MKKEPTKKRYIPSEEMEDIDEQEELQMQSIRFLVNVVNATIYSSGDDYNAALEEFFPQIQALGSLIGAESIDEVSDFLRRRSAWY